MTVKASRKSTRGAYAIYELKKPAGETVTPHSHPDMEEAFYVLEGEFT